MFWRLLILFILVPVAEIYLFATLGKEIGWPVTIGIILVTALIGASLAKSQGRMAMAKFQGAMGEGRMPAKEGVEGVLVLLAGVVLLTPGFLTDAIGFSLLIPKVRSVVAGYLGERLKGRIQMVSPFSGMGAELEKEQRPKSKLDDGNVIDV